MSSQPICFHRIDTALEEYYRRLGHLDYRDINGTGKFMKFIIDEELVDDELPIEWELGDDCDPGDCTYTSMVTATQFPFPTYLRTINEYQNEIFIFYIMQHCYKYGRAPSEKYIRSIIAKKIGATIVDVRPLQITRADLNVSGTMTAYKYLRRIVQEDFPNDFCLRHYMNISVSMQINDKQMRQFKILKTGSSQLLSIINYDLHLKSNGQTIYGIVIPDTDHKWKLKDFLTAREIERDYKIKPNELPQSSRKMSLFTEQLKPPMIDESLFINTNWRSVPRNKGILKNFKIPEITARINKISWIKECAKSFKNDKLPFIPIIVGNDEYHWIEWIKIVKIESQNIYVAVSIKEFSFATWDRNFRKNSIPEDVSKLIMHYYGNTISSIHLDLDYIYYNHRALCQTQQIINFDDMEYFRPFITNLIINDVYIYPNF